MGLTLRGLCGGGLVRSFVAMRRLKVRGLSSVMRVNVHDSFFCERSLGAASADAERISSLRRQGGGRSPFGSVPIPRPPSGSYLLTAIQANVGRSRRLCQPP